MTGTESQIEWAERIRTHVAAEFHRVAAVLAEVVARQAEGDRAGTHSLIAILAEKRDATLAHDYAGYFIKEWQESDGRVRRLLMDDPRSKAIRANRESRER
ncbi:MAG: hypothetical protein HY820_07240 [Acidobacteria bacterium]|nr:hypothetical protein [Acidobacteriota bacterium]